MNRQVFLDTSFVIALENRADPHHEIAKRVDRQLLHAGTQLVLHWGIVLELGDGYARLRRRGKVQNLFQRFRREDRYRIEPLTPRLFNDGLQLYLARDDKEWGLTDCVSFALMRALQITQALTADAHFQQAGFEALLLPPSA